MRPATPKTHERVRGGVLFFTIGQLVVDRQNTSNTYFHILPPPVPPFPIHAAPAPRAPKFRLLGKADELAAQLLVVEALLLPPLRLGRELLLDARHGRLELLSELRAARFLLTPDAVVVVKVCGVASTLCIVSPDAYARGLGFFGYVNKYSPVTFRVFLKKLSRTIDMASLERRVGIGVSDFGLTVSLLKPNKQRK